MSLAAPFPPAMRYRGTRARSGFALVLALSVMALLLTFLIAAQGAVLMSQRQFHLSGQKATKTQRMEDLLAKAQRKLEAGIRSYEDQPVDQESRNSLALRLLQPQDSIYAELPGISHRDGDALLTLNWDAMEKAETLEGRINGKDRFLMNGTGRRKGAIHVR